MSRDPFVLDAAAEKIIGFAGTTPICKAARRRGLCPETDELTVLGEPLSSFSVSDFAEPDTSKGNFLRALPDLFGGRLADFLAPRPKINTKNCIGCGVCAASCPRHTISIKTVKNKKRAVIVHKNCIRCFCCQELCPIHAVDIHKNPIISALTKSDKRM